MNADPTLAELWVKRKTSVALTDANANADAEVEQLLLKLSIPDAAHQTRGAPASLEVLLTVDGTSIDMTLVWRNKTACRLPETLWLTSRPAVADKGGWTISKLGQPVNPLDADLNPKNSSEPQVAMQGLQCKYPGNTCGAHLHAVDDGGATYAGSTLGSGSEPPMAASILPDRMAALEALPDNETDQDIPASPLNRQGRV